MLQSYRQAVVQPRVRYVTRATVAALAGLALGGCSMSYQMGSMFEKDGKPENTGSIAQPIDPSAPKPQDSDLARAKQAASDLLGRGSKDGSQAWDNPATGASGTVTPMAAAYAQAGTECRDFLASFVKGDAQSWYQGDACKQGRRWEVRSLKPLRRT